MIFNVLITLMITFTGQRVQGKVITVNSNGGSESTECCVEGKCLCSSLSLALQNMDSNTIVNITSEVFTLKDDIMIGSGNLHNIMITSHITTITCSNTTLYCMSCDDVTISGITWVNLCNFALSNSTIVNCTGIFDFVVVGSIRIEQLMSSASGGVSIYSTNYSGYVNLTISESTLYSFSVNDSYCLAQWNITVVNSTVTGGLANSVGFTVCADVLYGMHLINVNVHDSIFGIYLQLSATNSNTIVSVLSSKFSNNAGTAMKCILTTNFNNSYTSVLISDTEFINNEGFSGPASDFVPVVDLSSNANATTVITLSNVNFTNNTLHSSEGTLSVIPTSFIKVNMTNVNFMGNEYFKEKIFDKTAAVYIKMMGSNNTLIFNYCKFINNTFSLGARVLYIDEHPVNHDIAKNAVTVVNCRIFNNTVYDGQVIIYISGQSDYNINISNTVFDHNTVDDYIINAEVNLVNISIIASSFISNNVQYGCMSIPKESMVFVISSQFLSNTGNCVYLTQAKIVVVASNFTSNIGSCIYLLECKIQFLESTLFYNNIAEKGAALYINQGTTVSISAGQFLKNTASLGGAIYVDLSIVCLQKGVVFTSATGREVTFKDNVATTGYSGDSLYFSVSKKCDITTNASDPTSLMYIPYSFHYAELNSTNCCDVSCSSHTKFPVITSPHHLILCGSNLKQLSNTTYFIDNVVLGKPVVFKGYVMDYFKKSSQPVLFSLNCTCPNDIKLSSSDHMLVDNASPLSLTFYGNGRNFSNNVTITFTSFLDVYIQPIEVNLVVQIVPCFNHLGYAYSKESNGCICYHHAHSVVKCSDHHNEIENGYWIGVIASQPTTSLCPARYCSFIHRNKFTLGYSELPDKVDAQCNHHRTGRACGECSPGYTLAYDTTNCISVMHCSAILTVVVVASTCAYWLIIVVGVFTILYFNRRISLGYTYAIIYYYSMVGILFNNSMYVSESTFTFISVMSSFTQLSPQFLGKLCLVKGLSGIDQLFIHYSHAVAVSLLVAIFVIAAKFSQRLSAFFGRCIIHVICLLLLLSYTSIASTSLQLLRPLTFTDIEEVYTYSSPSIQYFNDRHALYGTVAIACELVVGIGLPLLLLLEPFANKKINFTKIKPLLDQFQGCYKDNYRCFASYYLICRQIILLIVFIGNSDYNRMLFYLLITCIVIATVHMWIRPYKSASLNLFDGLILLIMVVSISINIFAFLQPAATELVLILVIFPLFVICIVGIKQVILRRLHGAVHVDYEKDMTRNDSNDDNEYQEPLLAVDN